MLRLETEKGDRHNRNISKATAYGCVLLTRSGQILLREPNNHFAGYVWTFAEGTPEPGDDGAAGSPGGNRL